MNDLVEAQQSSSLIGNLDVTAIASEFSKMVLLHQDTLLQTSDRLHADCEAVLRDVVRAVGFRDLELTWGQIRGINQICQYLLRTEEGNAEFATGWLDCMVLLIMDYHQQGSEEQRIVAAVHRELERGVPLQPIPVTQHGDVLIELPHEAPVRYPYLMDHTSDDAPVPVSMDGPAGVHDSHGYTCGGRLFLEEVGLHSYAFTCDGCGLRSVSVPAWSRQSYHDVRREAIEALRHSR